MLRRFWRWLKRFFRGLGSTSPPRRVQGSSSTSPQLTARLGGVKPPRLTDSDYEFLFTQLLEGVHYGWQKPRVDKFLAELEKRTTAAEWLAWLRRFGERLLAAPTKNTELATRMVQLGELQCGETSELANDFGMRLLRRDAAPIWEYSGFDATPTPQSNPTPTPSYSEASNPTPSYAKEENSQDADEGMSELQKLMQLLGQSDSFINQLNVQLHVATNQLEEVTPEANELINNDDWEQREENNAEVCYNQGVAQLEAEEFLAAIASFDQAIEIKSDYDKAWYKRGNALQNSGRIEDALASYDKAIELKSDYHQAWNNRGAALVMLGRIEDALASYNKAIELKSDYQQAWYNRGAALVMLGQVEAAVASFDKAAELKQDDRDAWYNRGNALRNLGRIEEALASYNKAIECKPDFAEAWYKRGNTLQNSGQIEAALASYDKAIEFKPDYYEAWYNRGAALADLGRLDQEIASYDKAIELKPDDHLAWYSRGLALGELGRFEDALASFDKAIELQPDLQDAWYKRGLALGDLGRFDQEIAAYDRAIELKPGDYLAWYSRGLALGDLDRFEEALASFDRVLELKPDYQDARTQRDIIALGNLVQAAEVIPEEYLVWFNRGNDQFDSGRFAEAIPFYDKAIELKADDHAIWFFRAYALGELGRFAEAIASYDKAIELKPDDHATWYLRGKALLILGRFEAALAAFDKVIEFKPDDHDSWYNRGIALFNLGRFEAALTAFDKVIEFKPDDHKAWINRGAVLCDNLGCYEEAIASYDKAIEFKRDYHKAWIGRGISAGKSVLYNPLAAAIIKSVPANRNPDLNWRGYQGIFASFQEGLKYCQQDTHPEDWGLLHQAIGDAHYFKGKSEENPFPHWRKAIAEYNQALKTLTETAFPELHLGVLQSLIRPLFGLEETQQAKELTHRGTDLLRRLLNPPTQEGLVLSDFRKKELALKFASFNQYTVDIAVQSGQIIAGLEIAEEGKNACLTWLLSAWSDEIISPKYAEIQQLLHPSTAIVYWHLSPAALTTFIIKDGETLETGFLKETRFLKRPQETRFLEETGFLNPLKRLIKFEDWLKEWNEKYQEYRQGKKAESETTGNWRENLREMLSQLSEILDIPAIESTLNGITNLILIPHRDLHRFPLHALFSDNFTITYLPTAQYGLNQNDRQDTHQTRKLLSIEVSQSEKAESLLFTQIESSVVSQIFGDSTRLSDAEATKERLNSELENPYQILHFTGHGNYNFANPLQSALYLFDDEQLTLKEVVQKSFSGYELITLSACETAVTGNQTITTEFVGLVSGFLRQGASFVLSTLWKVNEIPAALIVIRFCQLFTAGETPPVALKKAQNWLRTVTYPELAQWYESLATDEMRDYDYSIWQVLRSLARNSQREAAKMNSNQPPYQHPSDWAGFIIVGRVNPENP